MCRMQDVVQSKPKLLLERLLQLLTFLVIAETIITGFLFFESF